MNLTFPLRLTSLLAVALLSLGVHTSAVAQVTVTLDDFSTDKLGTSYVQKNVPSFSSGGWNIAGGELRLNSAHASVGGYAAFVWTSNALEHVGDSFSIDLAVGAIADGHNAGLSVWTGNTTTFDRVLEPRLAYNGSFHVFLASDTTDTNVWVENLAGGLGFGFVTLEVTLAGQFDGNSLLRTTMSFSSGSSITQDYTFIGYSGPLYVGPSAYLANGSNVAFDNLTFTAGPSAIPEPSTYAAFFGVAALGFAAWCRRRTIAVPGN